MFPIITFFSGLGQETRGNSVFLEREKRSSRTDGERLNEACVKRSRVDLGATNNRWLVGCRCCACRPSALVLVVSFLLWVHGHVCYVRTLRLAKSQDGKQQRELRTKRINGARNGSNSRYAPGSKLEHIYSVLLCDCTVQV